MDGENQGGLLFIAAFFLTFAGCAVLSRAVPQPEPEPEAKTAPETSSGEGTEPAEELGAGAGGAGSGQEGRPAAKGATYYVHPRGNNAAAGSIEKPWRDLSYAASRMGPGDITYLRGGTYAVKNTIELRASGTAAAPLTFTTYHDEEATLVMESVQPGTAFDAVQVYGSYLVLEKLRIRNRNDPGTGLWIANQAHHVTVRNCDLSAEHGVPLLVSGSESTFVSNRIHDAGASLTVPIAPGEDLPNYNCGVYVEGARNLLRGNHIYNNGNLGLQLYNGYPGGSAGRNIIEYNYVYHNGYPAYGKNPKKALAGIVVAGGSGSNNVIRYNRSCDNTKYGIFLLDSVANNQFVGNVTCYNQLGGVALVEPGPGTVLSGHISYNDLGFAVAANPGVRSDRNIYFNSQGNPKLKWGDKDLTLGGLRRESGGDQSSRIADPAFKNAPKERFDPEAAQAYDFATPANPALSGGPSGGG